MGPPLFQGLGGGGGGWAGPKWVAYVYKRFLCEPCQPFGCRGLSFIPVSMQSLFASETQDLTCTDSHSLENNRKKVKLLKRLDDWRNGGIGVHRTIKTPPPGHNVSRVYFRSINSGPQQSHMCRGSGGLSLKMESNPGNTKEGFFVTQYRRGFALHLSLPLKTKNFRSMRRARAWPHSRTGNALTLSKQKRLSRERSASEDRAGQHAGPQGPLGK